MLGTLQRMLVAPLVAATATALFATATPAAADTTDTVTTRDVAAAISAVEATNPTLIADARPSTTDGDSAAVSRQDKLTVDIPKDARDGITLSSQNASTVTFGLPGAKDTKKATRLQDGTIVYAARDGSFATANKAIENGSQTMIVIKSKDAPEKYAFPLTKRPQGSKFVIAHDGGVVLVDAGGKAIGVIPAAWAHDANHKSVKTRFTTDGTTLTQHVAHKAPGVAYPVVADPAIYWRWYGVEMQLNRWETYAVGYHVGLQSVVAGALPFPWSVIVGAAFYAGADVIKHWHGTGGCVGVIAQSWAVKWLYPYRGGSCR